MPHRARSAPPSLAGSPSGSGTAESPGDLRGRLEGPRPGDTLMSGHPASGVSSWGPWGPARHGVRQNPR